MSKVIRFSKPARRATASAPTTPELGPERTVRTGCCSAVSNEMMPPLLCVMCGGVAMPRAVNRGRRLAR